MLEANRIYILYLQYTGTKRVQDTDRFPLTQVTYALLVQINFKKQVCSLVERLVGEQLKRHFRKQHLLSGIERKLG